MTVPMEWYEDQVVLLTGGTGYLGACLLYKLAVQLPTRKVFVLCRHSVQRAVAKLEALMPEQIDIILDTRKVQFVLGNIAQPNWGLRATDLHHLAQEATVVLHAAAETSIAQELPVTIHTNCLSSLAFSRLMRSFRSLRAILYVSSAFVNLFVQDAVVKEQPYSVEPEDNEPHWEARITSILETGQVPHSEAFPNPYIFSKYLAEKVIFSEAGHLSVPLLIIRPSLISPAIRDPYPAYGVDTVTPTYAIFRMVAGSSQYGPERLAQELPSSAVIDEIPVDLVAATCLAHLAMGTQGIVHATCELYFRFTVRDMIEAILDATPLSLQDQFRSRKYRDASALAAYAFENIQRYCRAGRFECQRSLDLKRITGPLGLELRGHDPALHARHRIERMSRILADQFKKEAR